MQMAMILIYSNKYVHNSDTQIGKGTQSNPDMDCFSNKLN